MKYELRVILRQSQYDTAVTDVSFHHTEYIYIFFSKFPMQ